MWWNIYLISVLSILVMRSTEKNRYRYSIDTSINTQISFKKSPSRTSHPQVGHVFQFSDFEFFRFLRHLLYFPVISIKFFCFAFLVTIQWQYQVSIVLILFRTTNRYKYYNITIQNITWYFLIFLQIFLEILKNLIKIFKISISFTVF